jgi:hypothetical protein
MVSTSTLTQAFPEQRPGWPGCTVAGASGFLVSTGGVATLGSDGFGFGVVGPVVFGSTGFGAGAFEGEVFGSVGFTAGGASTVRGAPMRCAVT